MEFRVLGPLEVVDGDAKLPLGGPRQRLVLAYLVLEANRVVPTDRLIDRIWGDEPPDAARSALFAYISRLKKLLGSSRIQARAPGYVLLATNDEVDGLRFAELVGKARGERDPNARASSLSLALDLWRGEPLSDLADNDALAPAIARLEELRLTALEAQAEAQLDLGEHQRAATGLEALVLDHPLRERPWSLLMLALYRSGRQADALAAYHRARTKLAEELGIDPSPELRRLYDQILNQDAALESRTRPPEAPESTTPMAQAAAVREPRATRRDGRLVFAVASLSIVVLVAAGWWVWRPLGGLPAGPWRVALMMPVSGGGGQGDEIYATSIHDAVELAIDDLSGSDAVAGATLELVTLGRATTDDYLVADATQVAADASVIEMIGPLGSSATFPVLPLTNAAGLLECSPAATHPGLTKPRNGALDVRAARPQAINFLRLAPADDIQSVALASFARQDLRARSALVVDTTDEWRVIADAFETEFERAGGTSLRRTLNPGAAAATVLDPFAGDTAPDVVFLAADVAIGKLIRRAMAEADLLSTPLLSWDGLIYDSSAFPPGAGAGAYILDLGGTVAANSFAAHGSLPDHKFTFAERFRQRYGHDPIEYAAAGYACVEILAAALRGVATQGPAMAEIRELVRAYAVDPRRRHETVLGPAGFDANGDLLQQFVSFYRVDPSATGGVGSWVLMKKQDFGPAP